MTEVSPEQDHTDSTPAGTAGPDGEGDDGRTPGPPPGERGAGAWDDGLIARRADRAGRTVPDGGEPGRGARPPHRIASAADRLSAAEHLAATTARQRRLQEERELRERREELEQRERQALRERREAWGRDEAARTVGGEGTLLAAPVPEQPAPASSPPVRREDGELPLPAGEFDEEPLRQRLGALRELIGLSRTRVDGQVLEEASRLLDEAAARGRLPRTCTTVAIAGATGSGKSSLFNALAGAPLSPAGTRRPTTAEPVACSWEARHDPGTADGLLDRLGVARHLRCRSSAPEPSGLVLLDLPDHDSAAPGHRDQVDRLLRLVDAVVWVVDPEKYADAVLHERYLRPLAGYAEVTFIVLNQVDRLPGEAKDTVLDDLRRLLDEDGMALGEHGEPGARVLAVSALTGAGMAELREEIGSFVAERRAAALRLGADVDGAVARLRPVYADPGPGSPLDGPAGLTDAAREDFEYRLATAVGAGAAGQAAERAWLRQAEQACGTPWAQLTQWLDARRARNGASGSSSTATNSGAVSETSLPSVPESTAGVRRTSVARPVVAQAVRELGEGASAGLPEAWQKTVRDAAWQGSEGLPEALDGVLREPEDGTVRGAAWEHGLRVPRPRWWTAARLMQSLLLLVQLAGVVWLVTAAMGAEGDEGWLPVAVLLAGSVASPLLAWGCRMAARGPARAYGLEEERRLRRLAAGCGRSRVLEPVASELLRYREVREQYVIAAGEGLRTF
ncbi:GTPase [Streptomyces sp. HNM0574]|uniref:GTPase n=1 Tax=Streptomyces sp. HNM0574 TaxID=2714954 RepID=UPI003216B4CC